MLMKKTRVKLFVDILMFLDFLFLAVSGFVLWFALPRGSGKLGDSFILEREDWLFMHDWTGAILVVLIFIHLILNWVCITSMMKSLFRKEDNKA